MPVAAEASLEPLQGSTLHQSEGAEFGVGWASAWAAGAYLVKEAVQDGGVVHWGPPVALDPLVGGPEDLGPCEVVRQEATVGAW